MIFGFSVGVCSRIWAWLINIDLEGGRAEW